MVVLNFVSYDDDTKIKIFSERNCHFLLPLETKGRLEWERFFIQKVRRFFCIECLPFMVSKCPKLQKSLSNFELQFRKTFSFCTNFSEFASLALFSLNTLRMYVCRVEFWKPRCVKNWVKYAGNPRVLTLSFKMCTEIYWWERVLKILRTKSLKISFLKYTPIDTLDFCGGKKCGSVYNEFLFSRSFFFCFFFLYIVYRSWCPKCPKSFELQFRKAFSFCTNFSEFASLALFSLCIYVKWNFWKRRCILKYTG